MLKQADFIYLWEQQKKLDDRINQEHPPKELEDRYLMKSVAACQELGEALQEMKTFKFWSNKPASTKTIIVGELVDYLHFMISMAIEKGYTHADITVATQPVQDINVIARDLYFVTAAAGFKGFEGKILPMFSSFINLMQQMEVSREELLAAYYEKNKINHQRQDQQY